MAISFEQILYLAGIAGVAVFAISGALAAAERKLDILAFILFGTITGIGGGTLRDLILNTDQVFWVKSPIFLTICIVASVLTYFSARFFASQHRTLLWMDAMGLALFSVQGTVTALQWSDSVLVAIVMGMITPTFGSVVRDIILNQEPVLLGPEIYVTAAITGSGSYLALQALGANNSLSILMAISLAFALRAMAILWGLNLPKFSKEVQ